MGDIPFEAGSIGPTKEMIYMKQKMEYPPYCMPPGAAIKYLLHDSICHSEGCRYWLFSQCSMVSYCSGPFLNAVWSHIARVIN